MSRRIEIVEVGPRDGLQNEKTLFDIDQKLEMIRRLELAGVRCLPQPDQLELTSLQLGAGAIVTDSGVVQEATSALGLGCFTAASTTDREITVSHGTNVLLGDDPSEIAEVLPADRLPVRCAIPLWEGRAGERIADVLVANYALVRAV